MIEDALPKRRRTTIYLNTRDYLALRQILIAEGLSFSKWVQQEVHEVIASGTTQGMMRKVKQDGGAII